MAITPGLEVLPAPEAAPGGSVPASAPRRRCRGLSRGRGGSELRGGGGRKREREGGSCRPPPPSLRPSPPSLPSAVEPPGSLAPLHMGLAPAEGQRSCPAASR